MSERLTDEERDAYKLKDAYIASLPLIADKVDIAVDLSFNDPDDDISSIDTTQLDFVHKEVDTLKEKFFSFKDRSVSVDDLLKAEDRLDNLVRKLKAKWRNAIKKNSRTYLLHQEER